MSASPEAARQGLSLKWSLLLAAVALQTAALAWLGLHSESGPVSAPTVWWANAALVSVMLLESAHRAARLPAAAVHSRFRLLAWMAGGSRRAWPALLAAGYLGHVAAHLSAGDPVASSLALSACDIFETALAAYGVAVAAGDGLDLTEQSQLLQFVGVAVLLASFLGSLATGLVLHLLAGSTIVAGLLWFAPSALGMSIVPPLALGLARRETGELFHPRCLSKTLLYLLAVGVAAALIFSQPKVTLLFLLIPLLLFVAARLGFSGGAVACCLMAAVGAGFVVAPHAGPHVLYHLPLDRRIFTLQIFLASAVLSISMVGVAVADVKRARHDMRKNETLYRSMAESMEMLATMDPLTRLANRRRFDSTLEQEWHRAQRTGSNLSLVLVDADFFKAYNDEWGHLAGDECLRQIAAAMDQVARRPGDLAARFGGEEFGIILPETDERGARVLAESLRHCIEQLAFPNPGSPTGLVTICAGCATITPAAGATMEDLLRAADEALYAAKHAGRNRVECAPVSRLDEPVS